MTKKKTVKPIPTEQPTDQLATRDASIEQLITHAIDKNATVETMEKLLAMRRELKAEWAREQYHQALSDFQAECPVIKKETIVRNKGGSERYRYAALEDILTQVKELLRSHGFNYKTDAQVEGTFVTATCVATHKHGHSEHSSFTVPIDKEAFMNEPQKFASALTFSKRYAFCNTFGIQTGDADDDARAARGLAEEVQAEGKAPDGKAHRQTREYETESSEGDTKAMGDLMELGKWLKDNSIPEGFVLALLKEKKLVSPNLAKLGNAPPGVIQRTLASRERIKVAYKASDASPANGGQSAKPAPKTATEGNGWDMRVPCQKERSPDATMDEAHINDWRAVVIHFGKQKDMALGKLTAKSLVWWIQNWKPEQYKGRWDKQDLLLDAALCLAHQEMAEVEGRPGNG